VIGRLTCTLHLNRQQIAEWMRTESQRWGKVVKDNNIKAE